MLRENPLSVKQVAFSYISNSKELNSVMNAVCYWPLAWVHIKYMQKLKEGQSLRPTNEELL